MGDRRQDPDAIPTVAIFGCGRIGSALDEGQGTHVLTHAAACQAHPGVTLKALCDPDPERLKKAGQARGVDALYKEPEALLAAEHIDIAVIATPSALRTPLISQALSAGVRTFVIEKPLAQDLPEAQKLSELLAAYNATVALNYLRRYAKGLIDLKARLDAGEFGNPQVATCYYGKGLTNNGSHAIDLMRWWLGEVASVHVHGEVEDGRMQDRTLACRYELLTPSGQRVPVDLIGTDHRALSLFEFDLICTQGRLRISERGATAWTSKVISDPAFSGYSALAEPVREEGGIHHALMGLWEDLLEVLAGRRSAPRCTLADGLAALNVVQATLGAMTDHTPTAIAPLSTQATR